MSRKLLISGILGAMVLPASATATSYYPSYYPNPYQNFNYTYRYQNYNYNDYYRYNYSSQYYNPPRQYYNFQRPFNYNFYSSPQSFSTFPSSSPTTINVNPTVTVNGNNNIVTINITTTGIPTPLVTVRPGTVVRFFNSDTRPVVVSTPFAGTTTVMPGQAISNSFVNNGTFTYKVVTVTNSQVNGTIIVN